MGLFSFLSTGVCWGEYKEENEGGKIYKKQEIPGIKSARRLTIETTIIFTE